MATTLYWEGLFEVIERALSPRKGKDWRPPAPPSKRVPKRKAKSKTRKRATPRTKKAKTTSTKPRAVNRRRAKQPLAG